MQFSQPYATGFSKLSEPLCADPLKDNSPHRFNGIHWPVGDSGGAGCLPPALQCENSTAVMSAPASPSLLPVSSTMPQHCCRTLRPLTADPSDYTVHDKNGDTVTRNSLLPLMTCDNQTPPPLVATSQGVTQMSREGSISMELGEVSHTVLNDSLEEANWLEIEPKENSKHTYNWSSTHDTPQESCFSQVNMSASCGSSEGEEGDLDSIERKRNNFRLRLWDTSSDSGAEH